MAELVTLEEPVPLSRSIMWKMQSRFYEDRGPEAWRKSEIPYHVTTNTFIARAYAQVIAAFVEDLLALGADHPMGGLDPEQPITIVELGAGSGRLGFLLARALAEIETTRGLPRLRHVFTDLVAANVDAIAARPEVAPLVEAGRVDFAVYDAHTRDPLTLRHSGEVIEPGALRNPVIVVANYILDSLPNDAFVVREGRLSELRVQATLPDGKDPDAPDATADVGMRRLPTPVGLPHYDDPLLDRILTRYRDALTDTEVLMPVGSLQTLDHLLSLAGHRGLVLIGDKGYRRLADLDNRRLGGLVKHGSFSFMTNLDALGQLGVHHGGTVVTHENRYTRFTLGAFTACGGEPVDLPRWRLAWRQSIDGFGPAEYNRLYKLVVKQDPPGLPMLLLLLRLSDYDPSLFNRYASVLLEESAEAGRAIRHDLALVVDQVLARHYPVTARDDTVFLAGRILFRIGLFAEAAMLFERATREHPGRRTAWYNLGLSRERLGDPQGARAAYRQALEVDPSYERPQTALQRLG